MSGKDCGDYGEHQEVGGCVGPEQAVSAEFGETLAFEPDHGGNGNVGGGEQRTIGERPGTKSKANILRIREGVQREAGEASNAREVLVEGENGGAVMHGDGGNQRADRGQADALGTGEPEDGGCLTICRESGGFEDVPHGEIALDLADVASQALQDFGDDYSGNCERFGVGNHAAQFPAGATGERTEKVDPDGTVDQYQTRLLRVAFKSPFQTPLP